MLKKVLEYAGDYRKKTYQAIATMLIGVGMNILPFLFFYQIITPLIKTLEISFLGTILGFLLAVPFSFLASNVVTKNRIGLLILRFFTCGINGGDFWYW